MPEFKNQWSSLIRLVVANNAYTKVYSFKRSAYLGYILDLSSELLIVFCWHAVQLVFLPPIVPLRGKRVVYCCYVNQ